VVATIRSDAGRWGVLRCDAGMRRRRLPAAAATRRSTPPGLAALTVLMDERITWHTPGRSSLAGDARNRDETFAQYGRYGAETAGTLRAGFRTAAATDDAG